MPQAMPALVNSVICWGSSVPRIRVALVPAPAFDVAEALHEAGDVGRLRQVRRHRDEQRPAVLLLGVAVDPTSPTSRARRDSVASRRASPTSLGVPLEVEQPIVVEDPRALAAERERRDAIGDRLRDGREAVAEVRDHVGTRAQRGDRDGQIVPGLRLELFRVRRWRLVDTLVLDAVLLHEVLAQRPEGLAVHRVRRAVRFVVVFPVAAALARLEPAHRWRLRGIGTAADLGHDPRDLIPLHALLRAEDAPPVGREPVVGCAVHDGGQRVLVDAEVVPVDEEDQVRETESPRGVLRLMRRTRGEPTFALEHEDLDLFATGELERHRLPGGWRHAVTGRPGVRLHEERLPRELGMPGKAVVAPQQQEILPGERVLALERERETRIAVALVPQAHRLVHRRERRVDERHGVAGREHEPVGERPPRAEHVPPHRAREHERDEHVDLRPRAAGMAALPVVQREVDELVDQVLGEFPHRERAPSARKQAFGVHRHGAGHRLVCSTIQLCP